MKCQYPNCRNTALWTPVVEIPTIRTAGDGPPKLMDKPTLLVGEGICALHRNNYNLLDWLGVGDWAKMQEGARDYGYRLEMDLIRIRFEPLGWTIDPRYMEIERTR